MVVLLLFLLLLKWWLLIFLSRAVCNVLFVLLYRLVLLPLFLLYSVVSFVAWRWCCPLIAVVVGVLLVVVFGDVVLAVVVVVGLAVIGVVVVAFPGVAVSCCVVLSTFCLLLPPLFLPVFVQYSSIQDHEVRTYRAAVETKAH